MVHTDCTDDDLMTAQHSNEREVREFMRTGDNRFLKRILLRQLLVIDVHNNKNFKRAKTHALLYTLFRDPHTEVEIKVVPEENDGRPH